MMTYACVAGLPARFHGIFPRRSPVGPLEILSIFKLGSRWPTALSDRPPMAWLTSLKSLLVTYMYLNACLMLYNAPTHRFPHDRSERTGE